MNGERIAGAGRTIEEALAVAEVDAAAMDTGADPRYPRELRVRPATERLVDLVLDLGEEAAGSSVCYLVDLGIWDVVAQDLPHGTWWVTSERTYYVGADGATWEIRDGEAPEIVEGVAPWADYLPRAELDEESLRLAEASERAWSGLDAGEAPRVEVVQ